MSDEQTMYIEPEDDVTTVRERLRQAMSKQLTLVIPPQSQLRSHLTWRLLYARARELGKDVLIVSSDPQIRSLAHAVKFRVAHSLESSSQVGKSRPPSRPARSATGKSRTSGRPTGARDVPAGRNSRAIRSVSGTSERGASRARPTPSGPEQSWDVRSAPASQPLETPQIEDLGADDTISRGSPLFGPAEQANKPYGPTYDFRPQTTPPIHPLSSDPVEDEPDLLFEDIRQAQDIRQAATEGRQRIEWASQPGQAAPEGRKQPQQGSQPVQPLSVPERITSHPHLSDDPFTHMEDSQPPPPSEQRAGVVIEDFDINEPEPHEEQPIEEVPTNIIDSSIEYRGDQDDFVPPPSPRPITRTEPEANDEVQEQLPPRARQRSRRSGKITPPTRQELDDDALPAPNEPPSSIAQPVPSRRSTPLPPQTPAARTSGNLSSQRSSGRPSRELTDQRSSGRPSRELTDQRPSGRTSGAIATGSRGAQRPSGPPPLTRPASRGSRAGVTTLPPTGTRPGQARPASRAGVGRRQAARRQGRNRRTYVWLVLAIILVIAVALTAYYGPSANVVLTIKTQSYSHAINIKAAVAQVGKASSTLPAQSFSQTFTKSGSGTATGTQDVGTNAATGIVFFTNNGDKDVLIPSGISLTTGGNNPVEFVTTAEGVVQAKSATNNNNTLPITVQASQQGTNGNVDTNMITVIPPESLQKIAQRQTPTVAAGDLKLTVTNQDKTSGGGAQPRKVIADADLTHVQDDLSNQLKGSIDTWVKGPSHDGYLSTPQLNTTLVNTPPHNTIEEQGTFPATVKIIATVLLVHNSDLQNEAIRQLNAALKNEKDAKLKSARILTSARAPVKLDQFKQNGGNATSLDLTYNATAQAGPDLPTANIQDLVAGKSATDAHTFLQQSLKNQGVSVSKIDVQISPGFIPWVTPVPDHINLTILPA